MKKADEVGSIILATARGSGPGNLTRERPKCMLGARRQILLRRQIGALSKHRVRDVIVVPGQRPKAIDGPGILPRASLADLINRPMVRGERSTVVYVTGHCTDVDDVSDLAQARNAP